MNNQQNAPRRATTIEGYLRHVAKIKKQWSYPVLAFRGQKDKDWPLESAAERRLKKNAKSEGKVAGDSFIEYHRDLIDRCKLKNYDKRRGEQLYELEILADLRHHGGAVCLIDFTRNALVALWFACENSDASGSVFVVNTADEETFLKVAHKDTKKPIEAILHVITREADTDKDQEVEFQEQGTLVESQDKPHFWHWTPAHLNERITAQHSLFVFGVLSSNKLRSQKIIIELKSKDQIRRELKEIHDICEESLFPDFVGFAHTHRIDAPHEIISAEEYFYRGLEPQQQGKLDHAIQNHTKAIRRNSQFPEAYYYRGLAYGSKGDFDRAIQDYNKAIEINPNYIKAYNNRGIAYSNKGDSDQAIQDYTKAIEINPNDAAAYNNRGVAYKGKGDFDRAIQDYNKAIELNLNYAYAYNNRGIAYSNKGDSDQAIQDYTKAIEINPNDAAAYNNRGVAYKGKGDFDRAIQDYNKAIELNPNYATACNNRGIVELILGKWEKARADLTDAKKTGMDIAAAFRRQYGSVAEFGRRYGIRLPADIAALLSAGSA